MADDPKKIVLEQTKALREIFEAQTEAAAAGLKALDVIDEAEGNGEPPPDVEPQVKGQAFQAGWRVFSGSLTDVVSFPSFQAQFPLSAYTICGTLLPWSTPESTRGVWTIGTGDTAPLQVRLNQYQGSTKLWLKAGGSAPAESLPLTIGQPVPFVVRVSDGQGQGKLFVGRHSPIDMGFCGMLAPGPITVGALVGYGPSPQDPLRGALYDLRVYDGALSDEAIDTYLTQSLPALPDEPDNGEPPPPPPPPPDGEDPKPPETVRTVEVTPESAAAAFAAMQAKTRFQLTAGTYRLPTIIPKDDCMFVAVGGKAIFDGQAADKRAFAGPGSRVWIQGLTMRNYRGPGMPAEFKKLGGRPQGSQFGVIHPETGRGKGPAKNWVILDCDISENYCRGISAGEGFTVKRCRLTNNGGNGITGRAGYIAIEDCTVIGNQRFGVETTWDGAGIKLLGGAFADKAPPARSCAVRRCVVGNNNGFGVWFDWNCFLGEVSNCSIYGNSFPGVQMEGSALIHLHHNQIGNNLDGNPFGIFTFEIGYQNSKKCTVEHNLIVCSRHGVARIGQQNRTSVGGGSPQGDAHVGHFTATENIFSDNVVIMQTAGGFGYQHDQHGCSNNDYNNHGMTCPQQEGQGFGVNPPLPGNVRDAGLILNAFGWLPQKGQDLRNRAERNTYRGTPGSRWSFEKDAKLLGPMAAPDWSKVPTWDEPPGMD